MLHDAPLPPQPALPTPWSKIFGWVLFFGLVIAFIAIPSFRHQVISGWEMSLAFFKKLFGF
jgi:hypothetical protein